MPQADHYTHGLLLYREGNYEQAIGELEPLIGDNDIASRLAEYYHALSQRALGLEALLAGKFDLAERRLRTAASVIGKDADLSAHLAGLYARTGRFDRCSDEMEKDLAAHPNAVQSHRKFAQALWRQGLRPQAHMALRSALRRFGSSSELYIQEGLFLAAEDRFGEARKAFESAVECDCTSAEAHGYLGLAAAVEKDATSAFRSFQRALELNPNDVSLAHRLAVSARAAESEGYHVVIQLPETYASTNVSQIRQLASYVVQEPDFVEAFLKLPPSDVDAELFEMLLGVVQMAISEHPDYADLHHHSGRILHRLGRTENAIIQARKAIEINPRYVQALILLGELHASQGRTREAIEYLQRAISSGGDWPDIHCLAAELMGSCGRNSTARGHLERALALKAGYPRARRALESLAA